jgi:hypothetical protein
VLLVLFDVKQISLHATRRHELPVLESLLETGIGNSLLSLELDVAKGTFCEFVPEIHTIDDDELLSHVTMYDTQLRTAAGSPPRTTAIEMSAWKGEGVLGQLCSLAPNLRCLTLNGQCVGQGYHDGLVIFTSSLTTATVNSLLRFTELQELSLSLIQVTSPFLPSQLTLHTSTHLMSLNVP